MPRAVKKTSVKKRTVSAVKANPSAQSTQKSMMLSAAVVVMSVIVAPLLWLLTGSLAALFGLPMATSLFVALLYKQYTGVSMSADFRRETTTITAVFAVILGVLSALNLPKIGLDGRVDETVLPIFMIVYMSVWAIVATLVTVFLPLGITVERAKKK